VARAYSSSETPAAEPIVGHRGSRIHHRGSSMPTSLAPALPYCTTSSGLDNEIDAIVSTGEFMPDGSFRGRARGYTWYTRCRVSVRVLSGDPVYGSRSILYKHQVQIDNMTNGDAGGRGHRTCWSDSSIGVFLVW
jgi:hypothetical protein